MWFVKLVLAVPVLSGKGLGVANAPPEIGISRTVVDMH